MAVRSFVFLCCFLSLSVIFSCSDSETLEKNYLAGKDEYASGDLDSALNYLTQVDKEDSHYSDTPLYLAKIEFYKGNFAKAEERLEDVLDDPILGFQAKLWKLKAGYASGKDRKTLLALVDELLLVDSSNLDLLIISGKINAKMGKISDAILSYDKAIGQEDQILLAKQELNLIYGKVYSSSKDRETSKQPTIIIKQSPQSKNRRK
ncbi:tetratricopeptide repeat protein [Leptospira ilyithenensis]|uniref:Tetratricopeptide repeat protein n=1 Tax=Leptospira ilyithenensis TaxID=2484901 RepID=A0A4R9LLN3_9LEPT|nr:tetratricopeptide repeat protein [Leptospira ilyithenensis]TGN08482.1 tetratricopeptide repeat protein [Leptospira ilyithenensis]